MLQVLFREPKQNQLLFVYWLSRALEHVKTPDYVRTRSIQ